jgi:hypothetical protein
MRFSLDVLRARKGDCLMLHYGSEHDTHLILIDGGPSNVYKPHLKPRLEQVRKARGLDEEDPLPMDAVMVSHVDDDHIAGILELTEAMRDRGPFPLDVGSLWHNSFDDLLTTTPKELNAAAGFGAAALAGEIEVESDEVLDVAKVLASIPQGRQLRDDAAALGWEVNRAFGKKLILAAGKSKPVTLDGGLELIVVGPMQAELLALQKAHDKWLRARKAKKTSGTAALAAYVDESIANLSSIVLLAELDGKRMLLTGDARGDRILKGLEMVGLLKPRGTMRVELLKVPHHGSANNLETGFFKRVIADHYVFSGNGEHGNPERETLEMLFEARGHEPFVIHLTYPIDEIDAGRKKDWEKERAKQEARQGVAKTEAARKKVKVRPPWSPERHSLAAFFANRHLVDGQEIRIVGDKAHVIDLLEPLGH